MTTAKPMFPGRFIAFSCVSLMALASAQQGGVVIQDSQKSLTLTFKEFSFKEAPGPLYHYELTSPGGQVHVSSKKQGIDIFAPRVALNAISIGGKEMNALRDATASGGVRAIKQRTTGTTEITGSTAHYSVANSLAKLTLSGPVKMTNATGPKESFVATGSSLIADLGNSKSAESLRTATLTAPVNVRIKRAMQANGSPGNATITAEKMVYDETKQPSTITLSGHVQVKGLGSGLTVTGALSRIVLTLNAQGEVVSASGSGG